jgi:hypothetical protein
MFTERVALICGTPPVCDKCVDEDAKVVVILPTKGRWVLCSLCLVLLLEKVL